MPAKIDLTGQIINGIQVIEEAPKRNKRTRWRCQCHCGNIFVVDSYDLRSGHTKSCGCVKTNKKDEMGKIYGRLTVIAPAPSGDDGDARWLCQCSCGKQIITKGKQLRRGTCQSCGCSRIEKLIDYNKTHNIKDITGQRFGSLLALEATDQRKGRQVVWKCLCDCGNETYVTGKDLRAGNTKSCGCNRNKSYGENKIMSLLNENNILFQQEWSPTDLIFEDTGYKARFDFYVNNNYIIEYDGRQHYLQGNGVYDNQEKLLKTQRHDQIKNQYCFTHNIPIIRIPYTEIDNITLNMLQPETSPYLLSP